jgi:hypothetical protein
VVALANGGALAPWAIVGSWRGGRFTRWARRAVLAQQPVGLRKKGLWQRLFVSFS